MKKLLQILMFVIIISSFSLRAYADANLAASAPESVNAGRSFTAVYSLQTNQPLGGIWIKIHHGEDILFKKAQIKQKGDLNVYRSSGCAELFCLSDDKFVDGELLEFTFTAKTGITSGERTVTAEVIQAVTDELNDISLQADPFEVKLVYKSDSSENKTSSQNKSSSARSSKTSEEGERLPSSSRTTASRDLSSRAVSSRKASSVKASSKRNKSSRIIKSDISESSFVKSSKAEDHAATAHTIDDAVVKYHISGKDDNDKIKYAAAGAGFTLGLVFLCYAFYRMGQVSRNDKRQDQE